METNKIIAIVAITMFIVILLLVYLYWLKSKKKHLPAKSFVCDFCGADVPLDFVMMWRKGDVDSVVCGKKECMDKYKNLHEISTNNE